MNKKAPILSIEPKTENAVNYQKKHSSLVKSLTRIYTSIKAAQVAQAGNGNKGASTSLKHQAAKIKSVLQTHGVKIL